MTITMRQRAAPLLGTMTDADVSDALARDGMLVDVATISRWRRQAGIAPHGRSLEPSADEVARAVAVYERCDRVLTVAAVRLRMDRKRLLRVLRMAGLR